jgi:hypothetical protein
MAKGLKVGDAVTVREEMRLKRSSEVYQQGLKRLKRGEIGHVIAAADGRSVVVEFSGKQVKLASQRLERVSEPVPELAEAPAAGTKTNGNRTTRGDAQLIDYNNPQFITTAANKLLKAADENTDPDAVIVQVRMSDLPGDVQHRVRALMQAKLELGPQEQTGKKSAGRRGRKPKNPRS